MTRFRQADPVFRIVFAVLVAAALALWLWQLTHRDPGPSRVDWPAGSSRPP